MTQTAERYGDEIFNHANKSEDTRLCALTEELDPATFRRLARIPLRQDARCLELGAGTGTVARWLAARCPDGAVTATDLDLELVNSQDKRHDNLSWLRHDVTRDEFPAGSFDLIHARYLFCHLPSREADLARVVSWLAPGGRLLLEEPACFPIESAADESYRRTSMGVFEVLADRIGTDCRWPRTLYTFLTGLGLHEVELDIAHSVVGADRPMARFWRLTIDQLSPALADLGISAEMIAGSAASMSDPDYRELGMATIAVWGSRR